MKKLLLLLTICSTALLSGQHTRSITTVLDSYQQTTESDKNNASSITLSLIQKETKDTAYRVAVLTIASASNEVVGSQRGVTAGSNFSVGIGSSSYSELKKANESAIITPTTLEEIIDFYKWANENRQPLTDNPKQIQMDLKGQLHLGMMYEDHEWKYYFKLGNATHIASNVEGTRLIKKLSEYSKAANQTTATTATNW